MADKVLDAKGLNCPLPILKAKKALKEIDAGQTLQVLSTDPGSVADFQAFSRTTGNELVEHSEDGGCGAKETRSESAGPARNLHRRARCRAPPSRCSA